MPSVHKSVLLKECIDGLALKDSALVVDATLGGGGHSREILKTFPSAKVIALDQDQGAWDRCKELFTDCDDRIIFKQGNFRDLANIVGEESVDGVIFDLGLSSDQLDNSGRGFTFLKDEPLNMNMKAELGPLDITAKDIVNDWQEENIEKILRGYGEESFAKRIAKAIIENRKNARIETTFDLVRILDKALPAPYKRRKIHFATKTFQALRMAVNDELTALSEGLTNGFKVLKDGGRMSVISFHSLEDRIVKNFYKEKQKEGKAILINKKVITASAKELKENKRARSAKLRILEKK